MFMKTNRYENSELFITKGKCTHEFYEFITIRRVILFKSIFYSFITP